MGASYNCNTVILQSLCWFFKCTTTLELSQLFCGYVMVAQWHELALASNGTPPINITNITV